MPNQSAEIDLTAAGVVARGWRMSTRHAAPLIVAALALIAMPSLAHSQPAWPDCPSHFPGGMPPAVTDARIAGQVKLLCYHGFAVNFSTSAAAALSSSEYLTRERMSKAQALAQTGALHMDARVPVAQRVTASDYAVAGYDIGQLSPSGDMQDQASQSDSFSMANTVPQTPTLSRGLWSSIGQITHQLSSVDDVIYVVSGPVRQGAATVGALPIPTAIYKAIYDPEHNWAGAYVCRNTTSPSCRIVTIAALAKLTGIDVFPAVPAAVKLASAPLPAP